MKNIFHKLVATAAVATLFSCSDFLDQELQGNPDTNQYFKTQYQLQESLNAVYNILQTDKYTNSEWIFGEACGDDVVSTDEATTSQIAQVVNFTFNTSNDYILRRYEIMYKGINRANQVIANAHKVKFADADNSNYQNVRQILGQAKFLRAMFYFNLVKTFGGVPIRPEIEDVTHLTIPRSTKEEVYAYIEKDLREAAIMLPAVFTDGNAGKVGAGAATALLMKVLVYQATPGEPSDKWEEVVRLGKYFVGGQAMSYAEMIKLDTYNETWDEIHDRLWFKPKALLGPKDTYETAETQMPVLANQYNLEAKSSYDNSTLHYRQLYHQAGEFCARSVFEIVFKESADGTTGDSNQGTGIVNDIFMNRVFASTSFRNAVAADPRRNEVILLHASVTFDGERLEVPNGRYGCMKWYTPKSERPREASDNGKNRRVIIYSDVVLLYAEALNETGNRMEALEQLNSVKTVANKITNVATLYKAGTYLEMRDQIWTERRLELCHLWDRYWDIVRQGRAASILHALAAETTHMRGKNFIEGINEVFPIPQNEIDITNGVVAQNPGY